MSAPALLTEAEAAEQLRLSERTLRGLRSAGKIRYVRQSPRKIGYTPDDLAEYIAKQTRQDEPPCRSTNPRKAASGTTTSSSKVVGITARRDAHRNATQSGSRQKPDERRL